MQSSLLAAGSLEPDRVAALKRHPGLARRYLTVEGHRALAANDEYLPPVLTSLVERGIAAHSDSPEKSLQVARGRQPLADPPPSFGTIRVRNVLAAKPRADALAAARHIPRREAGITPTEFGDDGDDDNGADAIDVFSSPVGGGGALGRLFQKMLGVVRHLGEGGLPGADTPTHRTTTGTQGGGTAVASAARTPVFDVDADEHHGVKYPEWDAHRHRYRSDWCTVQEVEPRVRADDAALGVSEARGLRRPLARLGLGLDRRRRQSQGDDIDIDAAVEARVEVIAGSAPDEAVYIDTVRCRRDLAVLILLDTSGSVGEPGADGQTVHEQQRAAAAALTVALHDLGDRVSLYAFRSHGRAAVKLLPVKRFDDDLDTSVMRRLRGLTPGAYSRLGAAIRHGTAVLDRHGGTPRRLLVVLSDGLAYDHGYERLYGAADARRALAEARRGGTGCVCLTIGASTDSEDLRRVFGSAAHATIPRVAQLPNIVGPLFQSALSSAESRRRRHQAAESRRRRHQAAESRRRTLDQISVHR